MANYNDIKNAALIAPTTTPDLGSDTNRYGNVYMSGNINIAGTNITSTNAISPRIASISYGGDDTAADPAGGQTVSLNGSGFVAGATVYINGSIVSVSAVMSSSLITIIAPAKTAGNYSLMLVNADGAGATFVPGIQYSGTPTWTTTAGSLATVYETDAISNTLAATSDSTVSYSLASGTLPTGVTLNTSTGLVSGTAEAVSGATTYNFTINAKDGENQDTTRNFSYTVNPDAVTWSSPAAGATLSGETGTAFTQALNATSAAGKAITYTANALPSGLSISGSTITGTPSTIYSSSSLLTATAATTGKTATRTVAWSVVSVPKQITYTSAGSYSWTAPAGVTSVCVVAVGGGGATGGWNGGAGAGLGWKNNIAVTPGSSYTVVVGAAGYKLNGTNQNGSAGGDSYFINTSTVRGGGGSGGLYGTSQPSASGGTYTGQGGGAGGTGAAWQSGVAYGGGGGAGGYSGAGGAGGASAAGQPGTGGGGGGNNAMGAGGGVGLLGQGSNGTAGGGAGSGGSGINYGGGSPGAGGTGSASGGAGAVRIIWGAGRAFPSTLTTDQ